jgi:hypothetical protein
MSPLPLTSVVLVVGAFLNAGVFAQFQVLSNETLANTTSSLSDACLLALQGTVQCNSSLQGIAASDYFYQLDDSDFGSFCAESCGQSLAAYHESVDAACAGQPQPWDGYPMTYFGDLLWASYNLTCLTDPTSGESCMCK